MKSARNRAQHATNPAVAARGTWLGRSNLCLRWFDPGAVAGRTADVGRGLLLPRVPCSISVCLLTVRSRSVVSRPASPRATPPSHEGAVASMSEVGSRRDGRWAIRRSVRWQSVYELRRSARCHRPMDSGQGPAGPWSDLCRGQTLVCVRMRPHSRRN